MAWSTSLSVYRPLKGVFRCKQGTSKGGLKRRKKSRPNNLLQGWGESSERCKRRTRNLYIWSSKSKFMHWASKPTSKQRESGRRSWMIFKHLSLHRQISCRAWKTGQTSLLDYCRSLFAKIIKRKFRPRDLTWFKRDQLSRKDPYRYTSRWKCGIRPSWWQRRRRRARNTESTSPNSTMCLSKTDQILDVVNHTMQDSSKEPETQRRQFTLTA